MKADLAKVTAAIESPGKVAAGSAYAIDGRLNDAFRAVNLLLDKGVAVRRVDRPAASGLRAGDFLIAGASAAAVADVARKTGVDFKAAVQRGRAAWLTTSNDGASACISGTAAATWTKDGRGGSSNSGGSRTRALMDKEIKAGGLEAKYDVIVLPCGFSGGDDRRAARGGRGGWTGAGRVRRRAGDRAAGVSERLRERRIRCAEGLRSEGRHARDVRRGGRAPDRTVRPAAAQRRRGSATDRVLVSGLHAQRQCRHHAPAGVRHAAAGARRVPRRQPGVRDPAHRTERGHRNGRDVRRPQHPAERLAARRAARSRRRRRWFRSGTETAGWCSSGSGRSIAPRPTGRSS